jgi:ABC-type nitrate/sulfonate/bicarbonate transport system substrate-binding protein
MAQREPLVSTAVRRRVSLVVALAIAGAVALGAATQGSAKPAKPAPATLRVGYAFAYDATSTGDRVAFSALRRKKNITAELTDLRTPTAATAALLRGDVDMICTGLQTSIQAISQGVPLKAILVARQVNEWVLVSNTTTLAGLRGKRVAFQAPKTEGEAFTKLVLRRAGLGTGDFTFTPILTSDTRTTALLAGRIDAAFLNYIDWLQIRRQRPGQFHLLARAKNLMPYSAVLAWQVTESYLREHRALLQRFVTGMLDAYDNLYRPVGRRAFIARAKGDTLKTETNGVITAMYENYKKLGFWPHRTKPVTKKQWRSRVQFWVRNGMVDADAPFNRLWDLSLWRTSAKVALKAAKAQQQKPPNR